jgi:predicted HicB family RNase H-like nuclease
MKEKRMSLIISPDLHRAFKAAAAAQGKEMTELILSFIEDYVQRQAPAGMLKTNNKKRGRL